MASLSLAQMHMLYVSCMRCLQKASNIFTVDDHYTQVARTRNDIGNSSFADLLAAFTFCNEISIAYARVLSNIMFGDREVMLMTQWSTSQQACMCYMCTSAVHFLKAHRDNCILGEAGGVQAYNSYKCIRHMIVIFFIRDEEACVACITGITCWHICLNS